MTTDSGGIGAVRPRLATKNAELLWGDGVLIRTPNQIHRFSQRKWRQMRRKRAQLELNDQSHIVHAS